MKRYLSGPATLSLAGVLSMAAALPAQADAVADAAPLQLAAAGSGAAPAAAAPAAAQPQPETLGAVVVTAQKREQKLEDVPMAVSAITSRQIETRGIEDIADLSALAPGLQVEESPSNRGVSQTAIRGNVQINPAIYWDTAVGVYLDGVFLGKAQGSVFDVVDLNRVEVLRGPQGTLYGRNTIGGAINLVTREPTGEFGLTASAGGGNYGAHVEKVALDLPRFSIVSLAFGAVSDQRDGWVKTTPGSSVDNLNNRGNSAFRAAMNLDLSPDLKADYRFDLSNIEENNVFSQLARFDNGPNPQLQGVQPLLAPYTSTQRQTTASIDGPSFMHINTMGHSLTLTWNANPDNTLKSITAYRHLGSRDAEDLDGSPLPLADTQRFTKYHQFSQELQWVGHAGRWNYVGGVYYFHDDGFTNNPQTFFSGNAVYDSRYGTRSDAGAAYGQVDYKLTEALTLTGGLRYTEELKALDRIFGYCFGPSCAAAPTYTYLIPAGSAHPVGRFEALTPSFSAAYRINPDLNTYLRYAQGFKSGGFNGEFSDPSQSSQNNIDETNRPFQPEKQITIEAGIKSTFFEHRAELNAAVFNNNVRNLQESIFTATGAAASVIRNAGQAIVRGVELEAAVTPVRGTRLAVNYAYLDAHYNSFVDSNEQVKDNRAFVHAPRNTFNVLANSRFLRSTWGTLEGTVDYAYTTGFFLYPYQLSNDPNNPTYDAGKQFADNTHVRGYGLLNLRLALTQIPISEKIWGELALWGRNVTDEAVATNKIDFGPGFNNLTAAYFNTPATYGITGTMHF